MICGADSAQPCPDASLGMVNHFGEQASDEGFFGPQVVLHRGGDGRVAVAKTASAAEPFSRPLSSASRSPSPAD